MQVLPITVDLSAATCREIGRVVVRWAALEYLLTDALYAAAELEPKIGRLVVKEGRAHERLLAIESLVALKGISLNVKFSDLRTKVEKLSEQRDWLAHGVWVNHPRAPHPILRITRGKWDTSKAKIAAGLRKVKPEGRSFTTDDCRDLSTKIVELANTVGAMRDEIETLIRRKSASPR